MKKTFLLAFVIATGMGLATRVAAQNAPVTLNLQNVRIERVLSDIEKQTNYLFVYNDRNVDVQQSVSIVADGKNLREVLGQIFANTGIVWTVERSNIILSQKPAPAPTSADAKGRTVEGRVTNAAGEPLAGVMVFVKGTQRGTTTTSAGTSVGNPKRNLFWL